MSSLTLAQAVWPRRSESRTAAWGRDALLVVAFSLLTAVSAQLVIPLWPVPATAQTFVVLLTGALLGPRLGALTMLLYLAEGCVGLPVFAGGHSAWGVGRVPGVPYLLSTTAGYLYAYPFAAALVGWLAGRGWDRKPLSMLAAMLFGSLVIYACGWAWLSRFIGPAAAWFHGVAPFLAGDAVKALLAAGLLPLGWKVLGKRRQ